MKKKILIFGAGSYIAKHLIHQMHGFDIVTVGRNKNKFFDYYLDFNDTMSLSKFKLKDNEKFNAVLFCQGLNPTKNLEAIDYEHFIKMYNINIFGPALILKNIIHQLNDEALCLFFSSIAAKKGSYDPSYASAKSAISGLMASLVKAYSNIRFNSISLGLVKNSPVFKGMSLDFREKHSSKMFGNKLINPDNVVSMVIELLNNTNINNSNISIDGGFVS